MPLTPHELSSQTRLKTILQDEIEPSTLERLAASLFSKLLDVSLFLARSGSQHGADAGTAARAGRAIRLETKRYSDSTSLSDRELLGEIDQALRRNPGLEVWILVATRQVPEQLADELLEKGDKLGLPVLIVDWKDDASELASLAALCTFDPEIVGTIVTPEARDLCRLLMPASAVILERIKRDITSWTAGFEALRQRAALRLQDISRQENDSYAYFGQNVAAAPENRVPRAAAFAQLSTWWSDPQQTASPMSVTGLEGRGKTWAVIGWLLREIDNLPIVLLIPAGAFAGVASNVPAIKEVLAARLHDVTGGARDVDHWKRRLDRLLERPTDQGAAVLIVIDGLNQESGVNWTDILRGLQATAFLGRVRILLTSRDYFFGSRLKNLAGLAIKPAISTVGPYDDTEFALILADAGLRQDELPASLHALARVPRLFSLVVRLRQKLTALGEITLHRLLWEYGREVSALHAERSFTDEEWQTWLQTRARDYRNGISTVSLPALAQSAARADLTPEQIAGRLGNILDSQFLVPSGAGQFALSDSAIAHALGIALLFDLESHSSELEDQIRQRLDRWLDPIAGLDLRADIMRAATSIALAKSPAAAPPVMQAIVAGWLQSQHLSFENRQEIVALGRALLHPLLQVIGTTLARTTPSARSLATAAIASIPKTDVGVQTAIIDFACKAVSVVPRDIGLFELPPEVKSMTSKEKRFLERIGTYQDSEKTVLGKRISIVDSLPHPGSAVLGVLLQGYSLAPAVSLFEIAAVHMAIRINFEQWEALKWLIYLNPVDYHACAEELRRASKRMLETTLETGVSDTLRRRAAALLLWMTGSDEDVTEALRINGSIDRPYRYDEYLDSPGAAFIRLERRHADQVLKDKAIPLHVRIDKAQKFWLDPAFSGPSELDADLRTFAETFPVQGLDSTFGWTAEDHALERFQVALSRRMPAPLAALIRRYLADLSNRSGQSRYPAAVNVDAYVLLYDVPAKASFRALRLKGPEPRASDEIFVVHDLLLGEIIDLPLEDQVDAILSLAKEDLLLSTMTVLQPGTQSQSDALLEKYKSAGPDTTTQLLSLLAHSGQRLGFDGWSYLVAQFDKANPRDRAAIIRLLRETDETRLGSELLSRNWRWNQEQDAYAAHDGSLALIATGRGVPFHTIASHIAPWLLLVAVEEQGRGIDELKIAATAIEKFLLNSTIPTPDFAIHFTLDRSRDANSPLDFTMSDVPPETVEDSPEALQQFLDQGQGTEHANRILNETNNRIIEMRRSGAPFLLVDFSHVGIARLCAECPETVDRWLDGAEDRTSDFLKRIQLAQGLFVRLAEALLRSAPARGAMLWSVLAGNQLATHNGVGRVNELIHILFAVPDCPEVEEARGMVLDLAVANTDNSLLDIAIAATSNGRQDWLGRKINEDAASDLPWRRHRAYILSSYFGGMALAESTAWPEGNLTASEELKSHAAFTLMRDAYAKHWWQSFIRSGSAEEAYAAWILFLASSDRRAATWMKLSDLDAAPLGRTKKIHFQLNRRHLTSAWEKADDELKKTFLNRRLHGSAPPWNISPVRLVQQVIGTKEN